MSLTLLFLLLLLLLLLRSYSSAEVAIPAALGIMALTQGMWPVGVLLLGLSGLVVLVFWLWRQQIDLVTRLLGMAGRGLSANPGLVPLALALQLVLVGLMELPLVLAVIAAAMNGTLVYNPDRVDGGSALLAKTAEEQCVDGAGESVPCCVWQTESWVPVYFAFAGIAMTWSLFLAFQIKMYTVAGSTAQWYFQTAAGSETSFSDDSVRRRSPGRTLTSLRHAVGPSLGTLCAGSAVLTLVSMIRQAIQKARREQGNNIVAACVAACLSVLLALMEFVTRFATVRAAITGEAFFTAGRNVVALLSRNAMDAFGVCGGLLADQAPAFAALTALVGFLAAWAVLGFLASLMLNVVDSLFVCVGMDRDVGQVSSLEIHTVMSKLPTVGPVVQQPDGGVAYGAPQVYQQPQPQQGPMGRGSVARV
ncbi:hypothetical protein VOLCADRAFT_103885 [Volvox carteri f. nagariensis]|uniref:Choline transporter-like protein n=1 Tax=Volvox carteri f. nagariensis TaxID=3068 RepID=D8TPV4_VOLCA|nr:uncharacterized protein VOLCADRAFT_103885 [Volvox carteri f. nagariensis]EFJ50294.1 hypothetical protein VOLCADRAFT_103885 [Volvox carteri f. nagariensis]|eukprot:XP_002948419.1 hypothetical protein VOLCADRAFT_103885 [Volvox carteri f. nagariensis]